MATANDVVKQAIAWLGYSESNYYYKKIIDIYNLHKPLPRGYAVKYSDEWCATFVSAVAIMTGATNIIPVECSCNYMIAGFKSLCRWIENDAYTPKAGDIIFYDWQDSGKGDNTGSSDHVGIVERVCGGYITVIEGNKNEVVARRVIKINSKFIRGFGVPDYKKEDVKTKIEINYYGNKEMIKSLNIEGSNYVNLREFCALVGLEIAEYNKETKAVTLKIKF
jgi:hypothetical protein